MKFKWFVAVLAVFLFGVILGVFHMFFGENKMYYTANTNGAAEGALYDAKASPKLIFSTVKMIIDKNYVERIDNDLYEKMSVDLAKGMLRELGDENCRFVDRDEMKLIENAANGVFEGVGIRCSVRPVNVNGIMEEKLFVASVIPLSPADRSGISNGEMIVSVNNKEVLPYNPLARAEKILKEFQLKPDRSRIKELQAKIDEESKRAEKGIPILEAEKLLSYSAKKNVIFRTDKRGYNLKPEQWTLTPVKKEIYKDIPYLEITCLTDRTGTLLGEYISEMNKTKTKIMVLDLRDVFGGDYDSAKDAAKWFVPETSLGTLKTKKNKLDLKVPKNPDPWSGKTIILVNKGTAKYGELLANAIGRDKDAVIVGEETGGDFKDISVYDLGYGTGFTLTTGEYIPLNKIKKIIPEIKCAPGHNGREIDSKIIDKATAVLLAGDKKK